MVQISTIHPQCAPSHLQVIDVTAPDDTNCSHTVDVSGALGSTQDSSARGPGFDSHPDPYGFFGNLPSPFFQTTDLNTISFICYIVMSS